MLDSDLDGRVLAERILELGADGERLSEMSRAAKSLGRPQATGAIADVADGLLGLAAGERGADVS
jgi:UDP-N-acetylglucosamine:LPS N-acetylglucosamine transferase